MTTEIERALGLADGDTDSLERFVAGVLAEAGIWRSPRMSDGVQDATWAREPGRLRVRGRIFTIEQRLHQFWLEVEDAGVGRVGWTLYFDPRASSSRRGCHTIETADRAGDVAWSEQVDGAADVRDGALVVTSCRRGADGRA